MAKISKDNYLIKYLEDELIPCLKTLGSLNDRVVTAEVDIQYFKAKEIEQNGLLRTLNTKVENLNFSLEHQINQLRVEMTNNNTHIEHSLNKKFQKQTWTILVAISIPIFLTVISLWLKACKILPVMGG